MGREAARSVPGGQLSVRSNGLILDTESCEIGRKVGLNLVPTQCREPNAAWDSSDCLFHEEASSTLQEVSSAAHCTYRWEGATWGIQFFLVLLEEHHLVHHRFLLLPCGVLAIGTSSHNSSYHKQNA